MKRSMGPRLTLILITSVFLLPLVVAWLMFKGVIEFGPAATVNHGRLIQPPVPLQWSEKDADALAGHWVVLHVISDPCSSSCTEAVTALRQVHKAMGRQKLRIQIALLLGPEQAQTGQQLDTIYASFHLVTGNAGGIAPLLEQAAGSLPVAAHTAGSSFLIDPLGNIMMFYEAGSDPKYLQKDLKRMLTYSKLDQSL